MEIRCKFKCVSITDVEGGSRVALTPVTHGSPENDSFFHYTPYGNFEMGMIRSDNAHTMFAPGGEYYIDITPAPKSK